MRLTIGNNKNVHLHIKDSMATKEKSVRTHNFIGRLFHKTIKVKLQELDKNGGTTERTFYINKNSAKKRLGITDTDSMKDNEFREKVQNLFKNHKIVRSIESHGSMQRPMRGIVANDDNRETSSLTPDSEPENSQIVGQRPRSSQSSQVSEQSRRGSSSVDSDIDQENIGEDEEVIAEDQEKAHEVDAAKRAESLKKQFSTSKAALKESIRRFGQIHTDILQSKYNELYEGKEGTDKKTKFESDWTNFNNSLNPVWNQLKAGQAPNENDNATFYLTAYSNNLEASFNGEFGPDSDLALAIRDVITLIEHGIDLANPSH